jgi:hypothetical protein
MINADRQAFTQALRLLAVVFRAKVTENLIKVYFRSLAEFDLPDVKRAMQRAVYDSEWFPRPVELRHAIEEGLERDYQRKVQAWNEAKRAEKGDD